MTTTLSEGVKVPDVGSVNWAGDLEVNWNLLNGALANLSGNVKLDRDNTWTGEQSFTLPIVGSIAGTASKAIADEDGTSIKSGYVNVAGNQTVSGDKSFTGSNTFNNILPNSTNTYSLGSSSYQWSSVYAQTYYYNGTQWGLDKDNVWSGINIFTDVITYKDTVAEIGNYPASNRIKYQTFADKNGTTLGYANFAVATNGVTSWNLWLENKATNGVLSPTGTQVKSFMGLYIDTDMSSKLKLYGDFIPNNTSRFDLGTSTNQWSSVYAQTYYYNGTAWGLDKANTWTGSNTYTASILSKIDSSTLASFKDIYQCQNEAGYRVATFRVTHSNSSRVLSINIHDNNNSAPKGISISNDGNNNINLYANGTTNSLGTSTNKWKSLNGVNPGALSLPDYDSAAKVDISGSIIPDQYNNIYYTSPINGWLYVYFNVANATTSSNIFYVEIKDRNMANTNAAQVFWRSVPASDLPVFFPVVANKQFIMEINFSNYTIIKAHVIPCLGNV